MEERIENIEKVMIKMEKMLNKLDKRMDGFDNRMDRFDQRMDEFEKREKSHFEHTSNQFERLEKKMDSNFQYLDNKIETTKNQIISEVVEEFDRFSKATTKLIDNAENKIKNEAKERSYEIDKLKNITEYDKIVLRNLESRISILEEEAQEYRRG